MAARLVRVHQVAHLRIDAFLDLFGEQPLADLLQIAQRTPAQCFGGFADEILELHESELVVESGGDHGNQLAHAHIATFEPLAGEDHRGETRDQRAVKIEERSDFGSARACPDLCHRTGKSQILWRCAVLVGHE